MNILFVLPWLPYPLISGGHQALYNGIAAISKEMDVSLAFVVENEYEYVDALGDFTKDFPNVKLFPLYRCRRIADGAKRPTAIKPWYSRLFRNIFHPKKVKEEQKGFDKLAFWSYCTLPPDGSWTAHLQNIIDNNSFDIIQVEMPWLLNTIMGLTHNSKIVYVHHELGFIRRALEMRNTPKEDYYSWSWLRFADLNEIAQLNLYDAVITLSPIDKKKLEEAGVTKPVYSSLAVVDSSPDVKPQPCTQQRLTFMGPEGHAPNFEGITWFLDNCWNKLKEKQPNFTLDIIGNWSQTSIERYKSKYPDVNFLGFVDDLSATLGGSIMIVPINIGSGIRIKILEATTRGIPFVSTTVGAEGIPVENGVHCFIEDAPDKFVDAIIKLQDTKLQEQFVKASNKMINECYSLDALKKNRLEIYKNILK